jgi:hypothetical protein
VILKVGTADARWIVELAAADRWMTWKKLKKRYGNTSLGIQNNFFVAQIDEFEYSRREKLLVMKFC